MRALGKLLNMARQMPRKRNDVLRIFSFLSTLRKPVQQENIKTLLNQVA